MIPFQIFQTWKHEALPPELRWYQHTFQKHQPAWHYQLLTDADLRAFVARYRPNLLALFDRYRRPICRVDLARYVLMWAVGGVYADLDCECLQPLEPLLAGQRLVIGLEPETHLQLSAVRSRGFLHLLSPAFLASEPGHPFWETVFERIVEAQHQEDPLDATGPFLLTRAYQVFNDRGQMKLVSPELLHPLDKFESEQGSAFDPVAWQKKVSSAFAVHHWAGSWWKPNGHGDVGLGETSVQVYEAEQMQSQHRALLKLPKLQSEPLVSALMVTARRPHLARQAVTSFQQQTFGNLELVIVDDDPDDRLAHWISTLNDARIRHIRMEPAKQPLGALRNIAVEHARGEWVCQWDDDDLSDPDRIRVQLSHAIHEQTDACFLSRWMIWWPHAGRVACSTARLWEGSMLARKEKLARYPELPCGEDTPVAEALFHDARIVVLDAPRLYLYVVHGANTFGAEHFDAHWQSATARFEDRSFRLVSQELSKRLDLSGYVAALRLQEQRPSEDPVR